MRGAETGMLRQRATWIVFFAALATPGRAGDTPGVRWGHTLTYDAAGERVVLFGGADSLAGRFADAWEWRQGGWRRLESAGPTARAYHAAVWDPQRGRLVIHGGRAPGAAPSRVSLGDTWQLYGEEWTLVAGEGPSPRDHHALAWDPGSEAVILFGGFGEGRVHGDTWRLDQTAWTRLEAPGPAPRAAHAMTGGSRSVTLHGGVWLGGLYADSWEWRSGAWRALSEPYDNPTRDHHAMEFDPTSGRLLVFGGKDYRSAPRGDLLRLGADGSLETLSGAGPEPRYNTAVAWDGAGGRLLVYGGRVREADGRFRGFGDLWAWDGQTWSHLH